ncbi:alpha-galactosidase [Kitasatospora sp. GAS204A]|uniref:alpha-galactosidase D n=1 Tax=unclassified Kitasatospora TaxID=2633591 RepID=UPI002477090B|nr:alpha-galactosidase [Kitasatospora sp. GAS204B]MDH6122210.1 alpha-galactosidase [Kitasatospora sp. GAS204B]
MAAGVLVAGVGAVPAAVAATPTPLLQVPPMGWNAWNTYGCGATQSLIESVADSLVANGMRDAGYRYVNVDDCWMARDANGNLTGNSNYPDMKALGDYLHARGFKFGIYESPGAKTCAGYSGSAGHEVNDADTFASWGVDYLKYDYCESASSLSAQVADFAKMRNALNATGRPIVFSINPNSGSNTGAGVTRDWGDVSDQARSTEDIGNQWWGQSWPNGIANIVTENATLAWRAKPGSFNDADMLEVGNGGLTTTEEQTHFAMWAMMAAPLIASANPSSVNATSLALLKNPRLIAIDQDALGLQARVIGGSRLINSSGSLVLAKPLSNGDVALALYNGSDSAQTLSTSLASVGIPGTGTWTDQYTGTVVQSSAAGITTQVPAHGTAVYRVTAPSAPASWYTALINPTAGAQSYEAEDPAHSIVSGRWINNSGAVFSACSVCSGGEKVSWIGGTNKLYINGVYAQNAGTYPVTVQYVNGDGDRYASIWTNGENLQKVSFHGNGNWNSTQTATVELTLNAGYNTITFGNEYGGWAPDIDKISVPATG